MLRSFLVLLLALPLLGFQEPSVPDPDSEAGLRARITELQTQRAALDAQEGPEADAQRRLINVEIFFLDEELALQAAGESQVDLVPVTLPEAISQRESARDEAQRALDRLNVDVELAPLGSILNIDALRARIETDVHAPFEAAAEAKHRAVEELDAARAEAAGLQAKLAETRDLAESTRTELAQAEQRLTPTLDPTEVPLVRKRVDVRRHGVEVLERKLEFLIDRGPLLESLVRSRTLELERANAVHERFKRIDEAAQRLLESRIAAVQATAQAKLDRMLARLGASRAGYERVVLEAEIESLQLAVENGERSKELLTAKEQEVHAAEELSEANSRLRRYRSRYETGGSAVRDSEVNVRADIEFLQSELSWRTHRQEKRDRELRLRGVKAAYRATVDRAAALEEEFDAWLERARVEYEREHASESTADRAAGWDVERTRWQDLKSERRKLLSERRDRLDELVRVLTSLDARHTNVQETRREALVLLQRSNLFLRGESAISTETVSAGVTDVALLPEYAFRLTIRVKDYFFQRDHRGALLHCSGLVLLAAFLLSLLRFWFGSSIRRRGERLDEYSHRALLSVTYLLRGAITAFWIYLCFYIPGRFLPDLGLGISSLLKGLGITVGGFWFGRRVNKELFSTESSSRHILNLRIADARHIHRAIASLIWISLVYWPVSLCLEYLGYQNRGAIEFLAMAYKVLVGVLLLTVLVRRSAVTSIFPSEETRLGRLLRLVLAIVHPFIVLLVPGLLILDAINYDILAGLIARVSGVIVGFSLTGYLAFHGCVWLVEQRLAPPEGEEEPDRRARQALSELARFALLVAIAALTIWLMLVASDSTWQNLAQYFSAPLPMQGADESAPVTYWNVGIAVLLIGLTLRANHHFKRTLQELILPRTGLDSGLQYTIATLAGYVLIATGVTIAVSQVFELERLGYVVAALSIGIGFGLQEIISNFISGLILLFERPLSVGDMIEVGNTEGIVRRIQIRSTTVQTRDNVWILVPNKDFITQNVTNFIYTDAKVRMSIKVGVKYGSDTALVRKVLLEVAEKHGNVLKKPAPEVWFADFGESSLDFALLVWVEDPINRHRVASHLRFAVDAAFRRHMIEIPFPQRDLHVRTIEAAFPVPELEAETTPEE